MSTLGKFKIGTRLGAAFAIVLVLLAAIAAMAMVQAGRLRQTAQTYDASLLPAIKTVGGFYEGISDARRTVFLLITLADAAEIRKVEDRYAKELAGARSHLASYESRALFLDDEDRRLWAQVRDATARWVPLHERALQLNHARLVDPAQADAARELVLGEARLANLAVIKAKNDWAKHLEAHSARLQEASTATYRSVFAFLIGMSVLALGMGIALAVAITRSITAPLAQAVAVTNAVAEGDLTRHLRSDARDELGVLLNSLGRMTENLARMVATVRTGSDTIANASAEIAKGNADLSARTEQQAAQLQETAASMQQVTDAVRANSDSAGQASALSGQAAEAALQGGQAAAEAVQTMAGIQQASRRIADIIGTIDGIAFQTNILALNAAVEAARAGEQVRGFAVVAGEVRSLAQRSAEAAREIKSLITDSVARVDVGTGQVNGTGQTIDDVVQQVRRVSELVRNITQASGEQSSGVHEINTAIVRLDQATQQNAALVEQTAAAAESLRQQAARLSSAVSVFRLAPA